MRRAIWMIAVCVGIGASFWLGVHSGSQSSGKPEVQSAVTAGATEPTTVTQSFSPAIPRPSTPEVEQNLGSTAHPGNQRLADFNVEVARYAQDFHPGLTTDAALPLFATLFVDTDGTSKFTAMDDNHQQLPIDGWSTNMEYRLRNFLEVQPEMLKARASVSCRSSQCVLQFMELPPPPEEGPAQAWRSARAMLQRLRKESWFQEELNAGPQMTTTGGAAVQYMVQTLLRRMPTAQ